MRSLGFSSVTRSVLTNGIDPLSFFPVLRSASTDSKYLHVGSAKAWVQREMGNLFVDDVRYYDGVMHSKTKVCSSHRSPDKHVDTDVNRWTCKCNLLSH